MSLLLDSLWRVREPGEAPADLGLAAAGGADHQDVLGRDLVAKLRRELLPAPAVAERDGDGLLGVVLADDVVVERGDDCLGGELVFQHFGLLPALGKSGVIVHFLTNVGVALRHFKRCSGSLRRSACGRR